MDIRFLTTFTEVVKTRHFGKAAENLYLTQSAVSARIKLLEEYFNTTLFIRHRNSIQLTPAGEKLLPYANQLCRTLNEAKQSLSTQESEYVVCAATQQASEVVFPTVLEKIHDNYPDWSVKAEVLTMENLSRQLHEKVIDLAFSTEPLKSEEVQSEIIHESPLGVFQCDAAGEQNNSEFAVAVEYGNKLREMLVNHNPAVKTAKLRTNSLQLALNTLLRDGGLAILPVQFVDAQPVARSLKLVEQVEQSSFSVYLNVMKAPGREGLGDVRASLKV